MQAAYRIETASGSVYELSREATHFRRHPAVDHELNGDDTWLPVHLLNGQAPNGIAILSIKEGERVTVITEPLEKFNDYTMRRTSEVTSIAAIPHTIPSEELLSGLVGLAEAEALSLLDSENIKHRITSRDGSRHIVTRDYIPSRVNLDITTGRIASYSLG